MKRVHVQCESQCDGCGVAGVYILHSVRFRGRFQHLCTACTLNNHRGSFCPVCFEVYDPNSPHARLTCRSCPSVAHLFCVSSSKPSNSPYRCPSCSDPDFSFFSAPLARKSPLDPRGFPVDKRLAVQLVAAAKIAWGTMNRAAIVARMEAERRSKEAVVAKKRAIEALEKLAFLEAKEKEQKKTTTGPKDNRQNHFDASVSTNIRETRGDRPPLLNSYNGLRYSTATLRY